MLLRFPKLRQLSKVHIRIRRYYTRTTRQRPAAVTHYRFSENQAELTCLSSPGFYYRLATSTDLRHWQVLPVGVEGTGAPLLFTYPLNTATEPLRFFQVVEVPE